MRDRVRAVWRAGVFLLHGAFTGFLALLVLPVLVILVLVARPAALRLVHTWTSRERERVAKFTGEPFPEVAPPEELRAARRDIVWFVTHALTGTVVGLLGASLPAAAVNAADRKSVV